MPGIEEKRRRVAALVRKLDTVPNVYDDDIALWVTQSSCMYFIEIGALSVTQDEMKSRLKNVSIMEARHNDEMGIECRAMEPRVSNMCGTMYHLCIHGMLSSTLVHFVAAIITPEELTILEEAKEAKEAKEDGVWRKEDVELPFYQRCDVHDSRRITQATAKSIEEEAERDREQSRSNYRDRHGF